MKAKVDLCLSQYEDETSFIQSFSIQQYDFYLRQQGRDQMILTTSVPTIAIARHAYGSQVVNSLIQSHLLELAISEGVTTTPHACELIADDIMSGYGDLKITELLLALKMIREGKFREKNGGSNRGQFYGSLSSGTICDCLHQFRFQYRNSVIDAHANELKAERERIAKENEQKDYEEGLLNLYKLILSLHWYDVSRIYNEAIFLIKPKDMPTLEFYAKERKALDRLRELCQGLIMSIDKYNEEHPDSPFPEFEEIGGIRKGVKYINDNFPYSVIEVASSLADSAK